MALDMRLHASRLVRHANPPEPRRSAACNLTSAQPTLHGARATLTAPVGSSFIQLAEQRANALAAQEANSHAAAAMLLASRHACTSASKRQAAQVELGCHERLRRSTDLLRQSTARRASEMQLASAESQLRRLFVSEPGAIFAASPLEPDAEHCMLDLPPLVPDHSVSTPARASLSSPQRDYRDEDGLLIEWPWRPDRRLVTDSEYIGGGFVAQRTLPQRHPPHRPPTGRAGVLAAPCDYTALINEALDKASADGRRGRNNTGVRSWFAFCRDLGYTPERPMDPLAPLYAKLEEEVLAMRFVCALVQVRGVAVKTAAKYFSAVQGWHARECGVKLAGGLKL